MEQRMSVMISAIVFAAVIAGSIAYLLYNNPAKQAAQKAAASTPQASAQDLVGPTPQVAAAPTPTPTPQFVPVATQQPAVAAAVSPSAPTGPAEGALALTVVATLAGGAGLATVARQL